MVLELVKILIALWAIEKIIALIIGLFGLAFVVTVIIAAVRDK